MIRSFVCAAAIVLLAAAACPRQAGAQHVRGNVQAGQELVLHHCDMCHVVANSQSLPPMPGYAPTFFEVATRPYVTDRWLYDFLARPHVGIRMPYQELTPAQIRDVSAYIFSLRAKR